MFDSEAKDLLAAGTQLGPYRIEAHIGAGGMGQVYRARDARLERAVAIKVLPRDDFTSYPNRKRRFVQEARAVSALNHPNIVILYDIASDREIDFLVLEYVPGNTLRQIVPVGGLPFADVVHYGVQIAQALGAAHAAGIVHRDIKPSNIIVTPESQVKVLDFGVAKLMETIRVGPAVETLTGNKAYTTPGMLVGTVSYMSPEQTRGEPLDGRSDIFSLGCVLYEAATGLLPFLGPSALAVMHEIATVNPQPPSSVRPDLPPEFDVVIERALAKDKDSRYASALELAEALQAVVGQIRPLAPTTVAGRRPEALVGREPEICRLREVLGTAVRGSGKIVFLTGGPGIGKSALAEAFLFHARRDYPELLVCRGVCVEQYGAGEAYLPFLDALSGLLSGSGRERVMVVLRRHAPTWCLQFPATFASAGTFEQLHREAIGATKERMLREFGDALGALASAVPVVLLLEDLQWSDPLSVDLLRHLGSRAGVQRLLLIGTLRPEEVDRSNHPIRNCKREMQGHNLCGEIRLPLLQPEHIASYLDARFVPNDFPSELSGLIYRKTEGHPLFSAALIQLLSERGDISKSNAHWTMARPLAELGLEVPESVRGLIRKKIEVLEEEDRRALQYASILGEEFTSTVLAEMLAADELALEHRLDCLDRVHGLIETRGEEELPDGSLATKYRFAHALYQNTLYEDLLGKHRALLHRQAGELLVRHYGDHTVRIAGALTTHFECGRDYPRAIEYLIQAAQVAMERYAGAAAEEHYSHALQLVKKLPSAEHSKREIALLHERGTVRVALGRLAEAENDFLGVLERSRATRDAVHECMALNALANPFLSVSSQRADKMDRAEKALQIAEQTGDPVLRAEAKVNLALMHTVLGEPAVAKSLFEAAIPIARSAEHPEALLKALTYRGVGHFFQTEFQQAEEMLTEASHLASRLRDGAMLRTALFFLGWTRANLGDISAALATLNELLEMARRNGDTSFLSKVPKRIAWIHSELQDFSHTISQDQTATETTRATHSEEVEALPPSFSGVRSQARAAEYWLSHANLDRAAEEAGSLLTNSTQHGPPKYVGIAHKILAEIAMARGDLARAEAELAAALEPFQTRPAPLVTWKIYSTMARLHVLKNNAHAAREAFAQGADIIQKIASTISNEQLRLTFLNAPAVQEVLRGTL